MQTYLMVRRFDPEKKEHLCHRESKEQNASAQAQDISFNAKSRPLRPFRKPSLKRRNFGRLDFFIRSPIDIKFAKVRIKKIDKVILSVRHVCFPKPNHNKN